MFHWNAATMRRRESFLREEDVPSSMSQGPEGGLVRGSIREVALEGTCPDCGRPALVMRSLALDLPYFGEALQTTVMCERCPFRHADLLLTREGKPIRYELEVRSPEDLAARVVRSSSGTIRVRELGVVVEPGPKADAFVSNAEGVLHRIRDIVSFASRNAETPAARRKGERTLADLEEMVQGRRAFTLVLEDPTGNSAILHPNATKRMLSAKEAARLKSATPSFRISR